MISLVKLMFLLVICRWVICIVVCVCVCVRAWHVCGQTGLFWMLSCLLSWILCCLCDLCEGQTKRVFVWESVSHTNSVFVVITHTLLDRNRQWLVLNVNRGDCPEGGLPSEPMEKLHLSNSHTYSGALGQQLSTVACRTSVRCLGVSTVYVWCEWTRPETKTNRPTAHSDAEHLMLSWKLNCAVRLVVALWSSVF